MKDYNTFLDEVVRGIEERLGDRYKVRVERILRNNACEYQSIVINEQNDNTSDCKISPAIHMDYWYDKYIDGIDIENIVSEVIEIYEVGKNETKGVGQLADAKNNVASHIYFRIVNAAQNVELLTGSPHVRIEDLAVTFHYMCSNDGTLLQSFRITDKIAAEWELTREELYDFAVKNTPVLFPEKFMAMKSILLNMDKCETVFEDEVESVCDLDIPMYVLTNETGFNGASVILYSSYIRKLAERFESSLYILPSSIHEVILIPASCGVDCGKLRELVEEVNVKHVDAAERLSDNVYIYSLDEDSIRIAE